MKHNQPNQLKASVRDSQITTTVPDKKLNSAAILKRCVAFQTIYCLLTICTHTVYNGRARKTLNYLGINIPDTEEIKPDAILSVFTLYVPLAISFLIAATLLVSKVGSTLKD